MLYCQMPYLQSLCYAFNICRCCCCCLSASSSCQQHSCSLPAGPLKQLQDPKPKWSSGLIYNRAAHDQCWGQGFSREGKKTAFKRPTWNIRTQYDDIHLSVFFLKCGFVLSCSCARCLSGYSISIPSLFIAFLYLMMEVGGKRNKLNIQAEAHCQKRTTNLQMKHRVWIERQNGRENEWESEIK